MMSKPDFALSISFGSAIPTAVLDVAGTGPDRDRLERLSGDLGLERSVRFLGQVENEAMPSLYRSADIALNPSLVDNMPISILEALASGVPVVSTNSGGIPAMVKAGEEAVLVSPRDPEAMASAVIALWEAPGRRTALQGGGSPQGDRLWMELGARRVAASLRTGDRRNESPADVYAPRLFRSLPAPRAGEGPRYVSDSSSPRAQPMVDGGAARALSDRTAPRVSRSCAKEGALLPPALPRSAVRPRGPAVPAGSGAASFPDEGRHPKEPRGAQGQGSASEPLQYRRLHRRAPPVLHREGAGEP